MVSNHPTKFGGHRHCRSRDIMFLDSKGENSICTHFNPPLLFISKRCGLKSHGYHVINSDHGHTRSKQQLDKNLKLVRPKAQMTKEKKKKSNCKAFCFTHKYNKQQMNK